MVKVIDILIEIKTKQARAFFATYGDMADAFARNEVRHLHHRLGSGGGVDEGTRARRSTTRSRRKARACSWIACASPRTAPHLDLTYGMINHILSPEPQTQFATEQSAGITNLKAVPMLPEELRTSYRYDDIDGFMQRARLHPVPPTDGRHSTRPMTTSSRNMSG